MQEEKWLRSAIIASRGLPEILDIMKNLYPEYDVSEVEKKAKQGFIPNPFYFETSNIEAEKVLAGLIHKEQAIFFLSYVEILSEKYFNEKDEEILKEAEKMLIVAADALAHAIIVLGGIRKSIDIAKDSAILLSQLVPVAIILERRKAAEDILTLIFTVAEKFENEELKADIAEAFAKGFEQMNLHTIAEEMRNIIRKSSEK